MFKNVAAQKVALFAFNTTTGAAKTGDAANITPYVTKDYGIVTVLGTATATELDATNAPGWYSFVLTQAETNADALLFTGKSATANISIVGQLIFTTPANFSALGISAGGHVSNVDTLTTYTGNTPQTGDSYARIGTAGAGLTALGDTRIANLDATVSSRLATTGYTVPDNVSIATILNDVNAGAGAIYTRLGAPAGASIAADLASVKSDSGGIKSKTDSLTFTVAGVLDSNVLDWKSATAPAMTGDAFARLGAPAGASVSADVAAVKVDTGAIKTSTDNLPSSPAATGDIPSAVTVAGAVWDEALAGHATAGTTGAALSSASSAGDPWATALPGSYTTGEAGYILGHNLDAAVSTRLATSGYTSPDNADILLIKAKTDNLPASPAATSDIPSASTIASAVWNALTSALTTVNSIGKLLVTNIDAAVSSRSTYAGSDTSGTTTLLSRLTSTRAGNLDNLDAAISTRLAAASYTAPDNADILLIKAKTDNLPSDPADESLIIAATDAVQSAIAALPTTTTVNAIKSRTDLIPNAPAAVSDIPTAIENADTLLDRDMAAGVDTGSNTKRTVRQPLRFLRNKWAVVDNLLAVYGEDDATVSWNAAVSTDAAAVPVIGADPTGP